MSRHRPHQLFGAYGVAVSGTGRLRRLPGLPDPAGDARDRAKAATRSSTLAIPAAPTIVGNVANSALTGAYTNALHHADGIAVSGHYAYVARFLWADSLTVFDLQQPGARSSVAL